MESIKEGPASQAPSPPQPGAGQPQPYVPAPPLGQEWAIARPGPGPMGRHGWTGPMARQDRVVGSWSLDLL